MIFAFIQLQPLWKKKTLNFNIVICLRESVGVIQTPTISHVWLPKPIWLPNRRALADAVFSSYVCTLVPISHAYVWSDIVLCVTNCDITPETYHTKPAVHCFLNKFQQVMGPDVVTAETVLLAVVRTSMTFTTKQNKYYPHRQKFNTV